MTRTRKFCESCDTSNEYCWEKYDYVTIRTSDLELLAEKPILFRLLYGIHPEKYESASIHWWQKFDEEFIKIRLRIHNKKRPMHTCHYHGRCECKNMDARMLPWFSTGVDTWKAQYSKKSWIKQKGCKKDLQKWMKFELKYA